MKFFVKDRRFIGSTIALTVGIVSYVSAVVNPTPGIVIADSYPAFYILLGALAYRSAKKRKLKLVENTRKRKILEFLALALIAVLIIFGPYVPQLIQNGDILTLVLFVWSVVAHLFAIHNKVGSQQLESNGRQTQKDWRNSGWARVVRWILGIISFFIFIWLVLALVGYGMNNRASVGANSVSFISLNP